MASVISKSEMTPSRKGRMATIFAGVRPTISLASAPTARTCLVFRFTATQDGSLMTIPLPRTATSVFAVPRSMPKSSEKRPKNWSMILGIYKFPVRFVYYSLTENASEFKQQCSYETSNCAAADIFIAFLQNEQTTGTVVMMDAVTIAFIGARALCEAVANSLPRG